MGNNTDLEIRINLETPLLIGKHYELRNEIINLLILFIDLLSYFQVNRCFQVTNDVSKLVVVTQS